MSQLTLEATVDRDLEKRVCQFLRMTHTPSCQAVKIEVRNGVVRVRGRVPSFYHRQLCVHNCIRVPGVQSVIDDIEVVN